MDEATLRGIKEDAFLIRDQLEMNGGKDSKYLEKFLDDFSSEAETFFVNLEHNQEPTSEQKDLATYFAVKLKTILLQCEDLPVFPTEAFENVNHPMLKTIEVFISYPAVVYQMTWALINLTNISIEFSINLMAYPKDYFSGLMQEVLTVYSIDEKESKHVLTNTLWLINHVAIDAKENTKKLVHSKLLVTLESLY